MKQKFEDKSGLVSSAACVHLPKWWNSFCHSLGAERCSYENYSNTSCRLVVTQKQQDGLQVGPSFIQRSGNYVLIAVLASLWVCVDKHKSKSLCICRQAWFQFWWWARKESARETRDQKMFFGTQTHTRLILTRQFLYASSIFKWTSNKPFHFGLTYWILCPSVTNIRW